MSFILVIKYCGEITIWIIKYLHFNLQATWWLLIELKPTAYCVLFSRIQLLFTLIIRKVLVFYCLFICNDINEIRKLLKVRRGFKKLYIWPRIVNKKIFFSLFNFDILFNFSFLCNFFKSWIFFYILWFEYLSHHSQPSVLSYFVALSLRIPQLPFTPTETPVGD